ncbi:MOSC domain-containing protein [Kitasatospora sp. NBC_01287]|uniref:MOSC domain-containing protein n=1 Tax=Kitasatospora sp. NBC_01287 TaxID=2903573 RepID=UPI0022580E57|nr:MOSC N-terminal beta barrel domain-containing protein [Kitasatospora sp. NBC_01287]MCX4750703.1 MOSC domain-containing protein [Kitasatospora sp. NBC_01287]
MPLLSGLHRYPVKSMYRQDLETAAVEPWGLRGDRRWMLARPSGLAVTQRDLPELARYRVASAADGALRVTSPEGDELQVPAPGSGQGATATEGDVFGTRFAAVEADPKAQLWFAERLGPHELGEVRLLHLADPLARQVAPAFSAPGETVSMADGFPLLAITTSSLAALNGWLTDGGQPGVPKERFRANLVIEGTEPWEEDGWRRVRVGGLTFRAVKLCGRCIVTTTDQETGERMGQEPLRTLAKRRRFDKKSAFGVNLIPERPDQVTASELGTLRLGDQVSVLARGERLPAA